MSKRDMPELVGRPMMWMFDEQVPGSPDVLVEHAIDISTICHRNVGRAVLLYGRDSRGVLVQLCTFLDPGKFDGPRIHRHLDDGELEIASELRFMQWAHHWGVLPELLARILFANQPMND